MRYERKYRIKNTGVQEVLQVLKTNPASFKTAFPQRWINSIYLDTPAFDALQENQAGISNRVKYRIRWYGEDVRIAQNPILEKKIKTNLLGTKERVTLRDFQLYRGFDMQQWLKEFLEPGLELRPVILVRYYRHYLVSWDERVRATLDEKIVFYLFNGNLFFQQNARKDDALILEIKYDADWEENIDDILQSIPFRLTKNSKYVNGVLENYY